MKVEHDPLEKNDLAEGLKSLAGKAKGGQLLGGRFLLLVVLLVAVIGVWWYLRGSARKSEAETWRTFDSLATPEAFEKFADAHANTPAGRAARVQQFRLQLAPALAQISTPAFDADTRKKAIDAAEAARDAFVKLADDYKDDPTMRPQCLEAAAKAELALVGIPKDAAQETTPDNSRGSVKRAAELFREYAKTAGDKTPVGEQMAKKAADLEANAETVFNLGKDLNNKFKYNPVEAPKQPDSLTPPSIPGKTEPVIPPPTVPSLPGGSTPPPPPPPAPVPPGKVPSGK